MPAEGVGDAAICAVLVTPPRYLWRNCRAGYWHGCHERKCLPRADVKQRCAALTSGAFPHGDAFPFPFGSLDNAAIPPHPGECQRCPVRRTCNERRGSCGRKIMNSTSSTPSSRLSSPTAPVPKPMRSTSPGRTVITARREGSGYGPIHCRGLPPGHSGEPSRLWSGAAWSANDLTGGCGGRSDPVGEPWRRRWITLRFPNP
jgi:hypothetical protein